MYGGKYSVYQDGDAVMGTFLDMLHVVHAYVHDHQKYIRVHSKHMRYFQEKKMIMMALKYLYIHL